MALLDRDDQDLLILASSSGPLDESPKENWVEKGGGLPPYVRKLARGIMKSGKSKSQAIAIAISKIKKWAAGGDDVDKDTRAKAAAALAKWEALKAKNKAKQVALTAYPDGDGRYLMLTTQTSFNTQIVRQAWEGVQQSMNRNLGPRDERTYSWIRELWTDYIIVEVGDIEVQYLRVPYDVIDNQVIFGEPTQVEQAWKDAETITTVSLSSEFTDNERALLADLIGD